VRTERVSSACKVLREKLEVGEEIASFCFLWFGGRNPKMIA